MPSPDSKFEKLTDGNYVEWKIYMEALLTRKNLFEVVDGTERHPGGNEGTKKVKDFYRKQAEARAEIILNVSSSQLVHCSPADPYVIWTNLTTIHTAQGRSTVLALRRRLHRIHFEKNETMSAYVSRVRHISFLLDQAGVPVSEEDMILAITAGLPHSYDNLIVSLDVLADEDYKLSTIITRLNNEYERQHMYSFSSRVVESKNDEALSAVHTPSSKPAPKLAHITCFSCGEKGHYQANCPNRAPGSSSAKHVEHAVAAAEVSDSDSDEGL